MSALQHSSSLNSSTVSSQFEGQNDTKSFKIKTYVKEILKGRIFLGRFVERRLTNKETGYRDVVLISTAEVELLKDLLEVQQNLHSIVPNTHWIGITEAKSIGYNSPSICLWTEIDNQPFGPFWFQIKNIKFRESEVIVSLKCLRHISEAFLEIEPILMGTVKKEANDRSIDNSVASLNETYTGIMETLKSLLSVTNVKEFVTFLFAFVIAIFTGSTSFVNFLGNFILALLRELSILIKNSTPMFLGLLDFFSKIVGGFYILLAMLFKQSTPTPHNKRSVANYGRQQETYNQYDDNQFD